MAYLFSSCRLSPNVCNKRDIHNRSSHCREPESLRLLLGQIMLLGESTTKNPARASSATRFLSKWKLVCAGKVIDKELRWQWQPLYLNLGSFAVEPLPDLITPMVHRPSR